MLSHAFYVCGKKASLLHHHILGRRRRFFSRETHLKHLRMLCWALSAACTHIKRPDGTNQQTLSWPGDVTSCSHTPIPCFFCRGVCVSVCVAPHTSLLKYLQCFTVCRSDLHQSVMAVADLSLRNLSIYGWKHGAPQESVRLCVIMCEIRQFFCPRMSNKFIYAAHSGTTDIDRSAGRHPAEPEPTVKRIFLFYNFPCQPCNFSHKLCAFFCVQTQSDNQFFPPKTP